ncbi:hypothetical protein AAVH_15056 [Aphelenchoides avenae]|nr:hypothetical protein AAVH_15056 [Aphelenchus avenae]
MFICQFVMTIIVFIFVVIVTVAAVYVALTIKDALERADYAIKHNAVADTINRVQSVKSKVGSIGSKIMQKLSGRHNPEVTAAPSFD